MWTTDLDYIPCCGSELGVLAGEGDCIVPVLSEKLQWTSLTGVSNAPDHSQCTGASCMYTVRKQYTLQLLLYKCTRLTCNAGC